MYKYCINESKYKLYKAYTYESVYYRSIIKRKEITNKRVSTRRSESEKYIERKTNEDFELN
jgi:hypothetical protein